MRSAIRGICREVVTTAVVVLAEVRDVDDMLDAVYAGAVGYAPGPFVAIIREES